MVRRGLADHVVDRTIARVEVAHPRAVRRHLEGGDDFAARLAGRTITAARRRGKYLWLELDGERSGAPNAAFAASRHRTPLSLHPEAAPTGDAVLAHLGMSGQMLVAAAGRPDEKHLRIRVVFDDGSPSSGTELRFVDQRTFGGLSVHPLRPRGRAVACSRADRAHRPRPDGPRVLPRRRRRRDPPPPHRAQAGAARPDGRVRDRQHLRGRGAVAGEAARRAADGEARPARRAGRC